MKEIYDIGERPPLGEVPRRMYAQTIRQARFGVPTDAFQIEQVDVPEIAPDEVLVYVMSAGINYNNVWAALGSPVDVIAARHRRYKGRTEPFHVGGSDASGIVHAIGSEVEGLELGQRVILHCGMWDKHCPHVHRGVDPTFTPSFRIWGFEDNWGSFAQFAKVQAHQCLPKPANLTWEESASFMLVAATAYRMLHNWTPHDVKAGDVVLVWGGAGGLGCQSIQLARAAGALPVAVVSSQERAEFCRGLGAAGCIIRSEFEHWGLLPDTEDQSRYDAWLVGARAFGKAIWDAVGQKKNPRIVIEHPGQATLPTSIFACDTAGMVVICAGSTGYNATLDLRYHWMRQKRLQGSHFATDEQAHAVNVMAEEGKLDPCLSKTFSFDTIPEAHQLLHENAHPPGNMAALIGATEPGQYE